MKTTKTHARKTQKKVAKVTQKVSKLPYGMQQTKEIPSAEARWPESSRAGYTPMGTGQPDQDPMADIGNPQGVQGGRGPLNQEGEGDRQNSQLAELEEIEPKL